MIQLIVEDAGERRGFRIGEGTLTVGAGPEAKLRLDAPDVAAIHADIEVQGGRAVLRPRPGVMRPEVDGVPVAGPIELQHDRPVVIGGARITAHYAEGPDRPGPSSLRPAPGQAARPASGVASPGRAAARPAISPGKAERVAHSRRRRTRASWLSAGIVAGVVALAGGVAYFLGPRGIGQPDASFEPGARMGAARRLATRGEHDAALAELDAIPPDELTPQRSEQVAALRLEIETEVRERDRDVHNVIGDAWKRENLELYERSFLRGTPDPGAVRFYLERLAYFAAEWPEHPELEWVRRMQERYASSASLDEPPTFAELSFKVRFYTVESDPKDWISGLAAIDEFLRSATGGERDQAQNLREATREARQKWFQKKLAEARAEYEGGNVGQSLAWLVRIIVYAGDPGMADQAAEQLLRFADLAGHLRGYRSKSPEEFAALSEHPRVAEYLEQHPLQ